MEIIVGNVQSRLATKDPAAIALLRRVCRAKPNGYQFMTKYKNGLWDGYITLVKNHVEFPTGLLHVVMEELGNAGYNITTTMDGRLAPKHSKIAQDVLIGITLRDYQVKAAQQLLDAQRGIAKMATNSGKTEIMAALCWAIDLKALMIVTGKDLMYQAAERFKTRLGVDVGVVGDGEYSPQKITIAMIQTLYQQQDKLRGLLSSADVLLIDECHHAPSATMMPVLLSIPAQFRWGFSGTPLKRSALADLQLIAATGPIICEVDNKYLIDAGFSARPCVYLHVIEDMTDGLYSMAYQDAYTQCVVNNPTRNGIIAHIANEADGKIVLVLVSRLDHGRILHGLIPNSVFVTGQDTTARRKQVLEDMKAKPGVYIATPIFDEGVDVPGVDIVVIASCGRSETKLLQRIGRGLRQKGGNNTLDIHDFIDDTNKHLLKQVEARINVYDNEQFETRITAHDGEIIH